MNPSERYFSDLNDWQNGDRRDKGYAFDFARQQKPDVLIDESHLSWQKMSENDYPCEAKYIDSLGNIFTRMIGRNIIVKTTDGRIGGGWSTSSALKQADEHDFGRFNILWTILKRRKSW